MLIARRHIKVYVAMFQGCFYEIIIYVNLFSDHHLFS